MIFDRRGHLKTVEIRLSDLDVIAIGNHQDMIEVDARPSLGDKFFNFNRITFGNPVLFTAGLNDRVHV